MLICFAADHFRLPLLIGLRDSDHRQLETLRLWPALEILLLDSDHKFICALRACVWGLG